MERYIYAADTAHTKHFIFHLFVLYSYVYVCVGKLAWCTHAVAHMQTSEGYLVEPICTLLWRLYSSCQAW